jgi:hypothetical protein
MKYTCGQAGGSRRFPIHPAGLRSDRGHHHGGEGHDEAGYVTQDTTPEAALLQRIALPEPMSQGRQGCGGAEEPQEEGKALECHIRVLG